MTNSLFAWEEPREGVAVPDELVRHIGDAFLAAQLSLRPRTWTAEGQGWRGVVTRGITASGVPYTQLRGQRARLWLAIVCASQGLINTPGR